MGKRFQLTESDKEEIKRLYLIKEESETKTTSAKPRKTATRRRRKAGDATYLDEVGNSDEQ